MLNKQLLSFRKLKVLALLPLVAVLFTSVFATPLFFSTPASAAPADSKKDCNDAGGAWQSDNTCLVGIDMVSGDGPQEREENCENANGTLVDDNNESARENNTPVSGCLYNSPGASGSSSQGLVCEGNLVLVSDPDNAGEQICATPTDKYTDESSCSDAGGIWAGDRREGGRIVEGMGCLLPAEAETGDGDDEEEENTCQVEGIGWIVCPVVNAIASMTDGAYGVISSMLETPASMFDSSDSTGSYNAAYSAWSLMRTVANVAFTIALLIIIYSQISSVGISNYGVKKLLPRLIIAAVLVNISFYVCALAVDISNTVGYSIYNLVSAASNLVETDAPGFNGGDTVDFSYIFGGVLAGTLLVGGVAWAGISVLLPIALAVVIAIITVVIVLTIRQALIILLVIISPLAFVAFLLPNTENMYKKWQGLFITMLAMFPAISLVFAGSAMAGKIVMASSDDVLVQLMGAGITVIPLFITPVVMKTAGTVLNRITGNVGMGAKNSLGGKIKSLRESDKKRMRNNRLAGAQYKGIRGGYNRVMGAHNRIGARIKAAGQRNQLRGQAAENELMLGSQENYLKKQALNSDPPNAQVRTNAAIRGQLQADEQTDVKNAKAEFAPLNADELKAQLQRAINGGDKIKMMASLDLLDGMGNKGVSHIEDVMLTSGDSLSGEMRTEFARSVSGNMMGKSETLKRYATSTKKDGSGLSAEEARQEAINGASNFSMEKLRGQIPRMQKQMINSGKLSNNTLETALDPKNIGGFEDEVITSMRKQLAQQGGGTPTSSQSKQPNGSTSQQNQSNQQSSQVDQYSQNRNARSDSTGQQQSSPSPAAPPSAPQSGSAPAQDFNPNTQRNPGPASDFSGGSNQTDSGLYIPRNPKR